MFYSIYQKIHYTITKLGYINHNITLSGEIHVSLYWLNITQIFWKNWEHFLILALCPSFLYTPYMFLLKVDMGGGNVSSAPFQGRVQAYRVLLYNTYFILNLDDTYKLGVLSFMHKYFYENLPASFHDMFNSLAEPNRTKSYKLERVLFKTLECLPSALFPKIWNSI